MTGLDGGNRGDAQTKGGKGAMIIITNHERGLRGKELVSNLGEKSLGEARKKKKKKGIDLRKDGKTLGDSTPSESPTEGGKDQKGGKTVKKEIR